MRVLLLADADFALREQGMLDRLTVGLTDEGVQVALAAPASVIDASVEGLIEHIGYIRKPPLFSAAAQAERLSARLLDGRFFSGSSHPDLIHVFGRGAWRLGAALARRHDAVLILEAWSHELAGLAARWSNRPPGREYRGHGTHSCRGIRRTYFSTPSTGLAREIEHLAPQAIVAVTHWGIHAAAGNRRAPQPESPVGIVLVANPARAREAVMMIRAVAIAANETGREVLVACDAEVVRRDRRVWKAAHAAKLLDRFSVVAGLESRRAPVLGADLLISILAPGEHRSVVLDAMGHGVTIAAPADPNCDWLDPQFACTAPSGLLASHQTEACSRAECFVALTEADVEATSHTMGELLQADRRREQLGAAAREWTSANRSASRQVAEALSLYMRVLGDMPAEQSSNGPTA